MKTNVIHNVDCVHGMQELPDECIDLTVTSPPYDNLRQYNGYTFDFESVAKQLWRVTKPGGVVVWIVGDQTINGSESGTSFRQALHFMSLGFSLHDTMIYRKSNYMPKNHNRYEQEFEYMFVLSKGKPKTFNPMYEPSNYGGHKYNLKGRTSASASEKNGAIRARDEDLIISDTKMKGNIWTYQVGKHKSTEDDIFIHPATFPEQLAEDHIKSWSNEGDIVFNALSIMNVETYHADKDVNDLNVNEWIGEPKVDIDVTSFDDLPPRFAEMMNEYRTDGGPVLAIVRTGSENNQKDAFKNFAIWAQRKVLDYFGERRPITEILKAIENRGGHLSYAIRPMLTVNVDGTEYIRVELSQNINNLPMDEADFRSMYGKAYDEPRD